MENEKVSSNSKLTEFLKQSFYFVGILSVVIMLNFNFRPSNTIQTTSGVSKETGATIVYQYAGTDYYNTIGLMIISLVFFFIFCGAIYSFFYAIKSSKVEIKD